MISRRTLFKSVIAAGALAFAEATSLGKTALAVVNPAYNILYGDGFNDDTPALQDMLNGFTVMRPDGSILEGYLTTKNYVVNLMHGTYVCKDTIHLYDYNTEPHCHRVIRDGTFRGDGNTGTWPENKPLLHFHPGSNPQGCTMDSVQFPAHIRPERQYVATRNYKK